MATEDARREGRCLCGGVGLRVPAAAPEVSACHCRMCRRWAGGPALVLHAGNDVDIDRGVELVRRFASSDWAERAFCTRCGSHLFYRALGDGAHYVSAGLFDTLPGATLGLEIFIDAKPDWYGSLGAREQLTEAEFLARVGATG